MKNYGLIHDERQPEDYILGGERRITLSGILQSDGDWTPYLPKYEPQQIQFDTMSCATFGTLNILETLHKRMFKEEVNKSDRYNAIMSGTTPQGNSPHRVAESIRTDAGTVKEETMPFSPDIKTIEQYLALECMKDEAVSEGRSWRNEYDFQHEWVFDKSEDPNTKCEKILEALMYSPVGVSVFAWRQEGDFYTKRVGETDNHWCMAFRGVHNEYIEVYDHYDKMFKKLKWGYDFNMAKRYALIKKEKQPNWIVDLYTRLSLFIKDIWR